ALARLGRPMCRILTIGTPGGIAFLVAGATAAFASAGLLVYRCPGAGFGFFFRHSALFITGLDMFGFALLLGGVLGLFSSWHVSAPGYGRMLWIQRWFSSICEQVRKPFPSTLP